MGSNIQFSKVEKHFSEQSPTRFFLSQSFNISTFVVDNYITLGQITALRFLEWVCKNPEGVIALPTGKTPEFFIQWVKYYLANWEKEAKEGIISKIGLSSFDKPSMHKLTFFQIDEFFPISPQHERSFQYFIKRFYVDGFGLNPERVNFIDTFNLPERLKKKTGLSNTYEVFGNEKVDLQLRWRKPSSMAEHYQKEVITYFDDYCQAYEQKIRDAGGIGFFLGGIGPDGHIAFNIQGSSHYSTTRLTELNYETQAAAAVDLGGIEEIRKKAVITIGLSTITYNPEAVAIIIAAGESKSKVVADALQKNISVQHPATALAQLPHSRFYITLSTCKHLQLDENTISELQKNVILYPSFAEKKIVETFLQLKKPLQSLTEKKADVDNPEFTKLEAIRKQPVHIIAQRLYKHIDESIRKGISMPVNQRILHTAPHHDDIELAYFPLLHHLVRSASNKNYFVYCTSGYTAVTNAYLLTCLQGLSSIQTNSFLHNRFTWENICCADDAYTDITGYLNGLAQQDRELQNFYLFCRVARQLIQYYSLTNLDQLYEKLKELIEVLASIEPGRKEPAIYYTIKGWIREFEAELVWAHFGVDFQNIYHLRLPFYSDDIFPQYPDFENDVKPLLQLMEEIKPTIITMALDPEGSGPDTHFKTLIAIAEAVDHYKKNNPDLELALWGYRNIWSRYEIYECNRIFPTSLNSFAVLHNMFNNCFISQREASFPSFEHDGTFSELAQKIWVEQFQMLKLLLGEKYFYE
ncbi:MAG: 6-phosphogluconolactonase, partial [Bacteroidales bacterium]|nr:6-phosphogluconolactonase [Bacteroidales bacterium]